MKLYYEKFMKKKEKLLSGGFLKLFKFLKFTTLLPPFVSICSYFTQFSQFYSIFLVMYC